MKKTENVFFKQGNYVVFYCTELKHICLQYITQHSNISKNNIYRIWEFDILYIMLTFIKSLENCILIDLFSF